ncbi:MAG: M1 family aminopeptidase, partial [Kofleriaceae bacterium]
LITYTETLILGDPTKQSRSRQHRWVSVAAHEMAHQWFGDLVTMEFWDDIWLNEGFANWMESKVTGKVEPSYRDDQSELDTRNTALRADSLISARQIRQPVENADDILTAFDRITYDKGATVLNMFEAYLGPAVFQKGVREYLAAKAWGNATSKDFAAAIAKASNNPQVEPAFASFLEQAGAPEITAAVTCSGGKPTVELAQKRYVPPGSPTPPPGRPWIVPVCVAFDKGGGARGETCTLLSAETGSITLESKSCPRWVMPNVNGRGYYRNAYTSPQVTALRDEAWGKLSWTERRAVYFDVEHAVRAGKLPLQLALSFVPKLLAGNDRFTIGPSLGLVVSFDKLVPEDLRGKYEYWLRTTFGPGATAAGFVPKDTDTLDIESTRKGLVHVVGWTARDPVLVAEAVRLSDKWRDLPQAMRGDVLAIAVDAKPEIFDRILKDVMSETDRSRRAEMFEALAGVRDLGRQKIALGLILEPKLDIRETIGLLNETATLANLAASQQFFRDHQAEIMKRVPKDETASPIANMAGLFTATCKAEERDAVIDYVNKNFAQLPGGVRVIKQRIEGMDQCIASRKLIEPELRAWLGGVRLPKPKK